VAESEPAADFLRLTGRRVLITGASSGIGRAVAIAVSRHGARVVLVARRADELAQTRAALQGEGHVVAPFDVTDHGALAPFLRSLAAEGGAIDGVLHSAGVHATTPLRVLTAAKMTELFDVNVTTAAMLVKAFRHPAVRGEDPSVVLMSSAVGLVGEAGVSAYAASKAAVASLARSLGLELAREGIRVNSIAAGVVTTSLTDGIRETVGAQSWSDIEAAHPLGIGRAEDVADSALYLLSPASRWVTGTALVVDGGYTAR
jgi:NAD(P)-dependent dehydrogenase (short-subunit alcohol dehydrogenase family)